MTDNVISFPTKRSVRGVAIDDESLEDWPYKIGGVEVIPPRTGQEYLDLCKEFLPDPEDYLYVLGAIIDRDIYHGLEPSLQNVVDHYWKIVWTQG